MPTATDSPSRAPIPTVTMPRVVAASSRRRRALVGMLLAAIVFGTALIAQLGCEQLRAAAPIGSSDAYGRVVTGYSWSLSPIGFTVRYDDGSSATRLWW